jgi:SAM-dependent methyltransferase
MRRARTTRFSLLMAAALCSALTWVIVLSSARSEAHAQTQVLPDAPTSFDVISIQTIDPAVLSFRRPGTPPLAGMSNVYFLRLGGSFRAPAISARNLIAAAFGVKSWQVVSGADWLATARFAINAKSTASKAPLVSADVGDARKLNVSDATFDVVLLFGPLYHLTDRRDRIDALAEARRVLVPGGLLLSAYISRFASACDGIREGALRDATFAEIVDRDLTEGIHQNPTNRLEWFTTSYFHRPEEIRPEIEEAGLRFDNLIAVEGPGWMNQDLDTWLDDGAARQRLLHVLRQLETEPGLIGASAHMLAVAHR